MKKWAIGMVIIAALALTPLVGMVLMIAALFPSVSQEALTTYREAAGAIGADWQELIAFDTVRYENDFEQADPNMTALEFLTVSYEKYREVESSGEDGDETEWVLVKSDTVSTPDDIFKFLTREGRGVDQKDFTIAEIMSKLQTMQPPEYVVHYNPKYIENITDEHEFDEEQQEWLALLLVDNQIGEMFGDEGEYFYAGPGYFDPEIGSAGFAWPTPQLRTITSPFGMREHPIEGQAKFHYGTDISGANAHGSPIIAIADGTVTEVNMNGGKAGIYVRIRHNIPDAAWESRYLHMSGVHVKKGDAVTQGTVIGTVGNTGASTGPHLHIEIKRNGTLINPMIVLK